MYKILFISVSLAQDGTQMFMMNVLRHIDRSKFQIDFCIYSDEKTPNWKEAESYGCKIYVLPSRRDNFLKSIVACFSFFKKHAHDYQAVHWNGGNLSSSISLVFSWLFRVPIRIVHAHSSSATGLHNRVLHKINRIFMPVVCNRYFACSSEASNFFFPHVRSVIINNGIDVRMFDYNPNTRKEVRKELGIKEDMRIIGHVGRFDENKNQSFILDVFYEYRKNVPNSYLILIGKGDMLETVRSKARELGVDSCVKFLGVRTDVHRIMQALDCFIMPSKYEGLPFVLVEAQCSGLYCVVSDTINHDVKITKNIEFLSLNSSKEVWSNSIEMALKNYSRASQSYVLKEKGFSIKETVNYLESVYLNQRDNNGN